MMAKRDSLGEQQMGMPIEEVYSRRTMKAAFLRMRKKTAPGVDGMTVEELPEWLSSEKWKRCHARLLDGSFRPKAVKGCEIPKPNGGKRLLGIPTVVDRLLQQAIVHCYQPKIDLTFSDSSFGYRPRRNAQQAVERWKEIVDEGYDWVVDIDLKGFFDNVHHDILMHKLQQHVGDPRVRKVIGRFLRAGMMRGGLSTRRQKGTPQGGPLSPLLSNVYLDELDRELESRGLRFVRYADDFIIMVKSEKAAHRVLKSITSFLRKRLRLEVNQEKSRVARYDEVTYLAYSLCRFKDGGLRLTVPVDTQKRIRCKLKGELTTRGRGQSLKETIKCLNPILRGTVQYLRAVDTDNSFESFDGWVRRRLRALCWRHWKQPKTRRKRLIALGIPEHKAKKMASSSRGPWRCSASPTVNQALPNKKLAALGLLSMHELFRHLQRLDQLPTQLSLPFT